ncbi:hypothetical protein [Rubellicoccus peritrichatus]|uniref:Uncharacterized protein n=1 Tax=Rubellicoccus peritrichatus TaxID=3080537 RepID=A0AAQ3L7Q6_9BACT|nr:hypothetical protein [Puniceicoccus sp. CR14]WOO40790.1 hypothetical protein RZN69_19375 [Puniceicoccus sp. CR14]
MNRKTKIAIFAILTIGLIGIYSLLNTRLGVHIALDVLSEMGSPKEMQTSAEEGPLKLTRELSPIEKITLPSSIEQPSGIKHRNDAVYISTDQTEIFKLDSSLNTASEAFYLLGGPLLFKQGSLEGIEVKGNKLHAIGEFGSMPTWLENDQNGWTRAADTILPAEIAATEYSGITDSSKGFFATSEDGVIIFNLDEGSRHELQFDGFLKDNANVDSLVFSGIAYDNNRLFILSESYTSIIVANASTFEVDHVFGIQPCAAADLSFHQGRLYIVVDHNYNEERPPVYVYDIDEAINASHQR